MNKNESFYKAVCLQTVRGTGLWVGEKKESCVSKSCSLLPLLELLPDNTS